MTENIINILRCPKCGSEMGLLENGKSIFCFGVRRHCYDVSSSGYVNLIPEHSGGGDSKSAVRSRTEFLNSGAYSPFLDALVEMLKKYVPCGSSVVDAGCGEGYYSCGFAREGYTTLGFDLSKEAVTAASKRAKREGIENSFFGVASVYALPIASDSVDCVLNIFAPCVEEEYARVMKSGAVLAVAYAGSEHLIGLKQAIYDNVYENEERADMPTGMTHIETLSVKYDLKLSDKTAISNLFSMTPYYWRTSQKDKEKLEGLSELNTTIDIKIAVYRKEDV